MTHSDAWFVLGFTPDDVVGAWQDQRLAYVCCAAWRELGYPDSMQILQAPGEGDYLIVWFMSKSSAEVLDSRQIRWRPFLAGECASPALDAVSVLDRALGEKQT